MKVAHFIDTMNVVGGAEVLVVEICRNLKQLDIDPIVLHFGNKWIAKMCSKYEISSMILPGYRYYKSIKTLPFFVFILKKFLKQSDIDILHSHLVDSITGACCAAFLSKTPHVGTLHDIHTMEDQPSNVLLLQIAAALGTRFIVVSHDIKNYLLEKTGFFKGKVSTIYNGIDIQRFTALEEKPFILRSRLNLAKQDFIFITVGRLVTIKDHLVMVEAFARCGFDSKVKLLIAGDGPLRETIVKKIMDLKLDGVIKMLGFCNNIPELLNISDCFLLSSRSEGLSCSIIEAMAAGLPCVVTNVGGNSELIQQGKNGYLVSFNNPSALAVHMKKVYDDAEERKKMAVHAKRIAIEQFSMDSMVRGYCSLYRQILKAKE